MAEEEHVEASTEGRVRALLPASSDNTQKSLA